MGGNPSIALEDMGVVQKAVATAPNLEAELQVEQAAGYMAVPMAALREVELFAPKVELKHKQHH